jgi:hypothetical protein
MTLDVASAVDLVRYSRTSAGSRRAATTSGRRRSTSGDVGICAVTPSKGTNPHSLAVDFLRRLSGSGAAQTVSSSHGLRRRRRIADEPPGATMNPQEPALEPVGHIKFRVLPTGTHDWQTE